MEEKRKEKERYMMYPVAPPMDVVYRNATAPYPVGPHSHNAAELYYTLTDLPDVLLNDKVFAVPAGTLLIIPTFCVHQLYHETGIPYERYILTIHVDWLEHALCEGASRFSFLGQSHSPRFVFPTGKQKEQLLFLFQELLSFSDHTTPKAMACFFQFLDCLQELTTNIPRKATLPSSPTQKKVNDILAYIREHPKNTLSIRDLASHFYLNPDYLARLFKSHMHVSLGHYLTLQKISTAEEMLREGQTVAQVQEALGYSSYAYFFKTFQKITGISPSQYRNQFRGKE
jgi:AraC-like DNA-binding protein